MKQKAKKFLIFYVVILCICQLFSSCFSFRMNSKDLDNSFRNYDKKPLEQNFKNGKDRNIHYVTMMANTTKPLLVFIHGSPGSWSSWEGFFKDSSITNNFNLLAIDRPGFGYSQLGKAEKTLAEQARLIKPILQKHILANQKVILIGHSLGGPLIGRMAMDYPQLIHGLIFVAASNAPELEPARWYRYIGDSFIFRYFLPRSIRASNHEILYLKPHLATMIPLWKNITCNAVIIHGKKDPLVPFENAAFTKKMLLNSTILEIYDDNMNHFVPWTHPQYINKAILELTKIIP